MTDKFVKNNKGFPPLEVGRGRDNGYVAGIENRLVLKLRDKTSPIRAPRLLTGFTAVEILIGLAVVLVIFSIALGPLKSFRDNQILASDTENVLSLLKEARSQTVFSKNSSQYGVRFEPGRAVLFPGTIFSEPNANNKELPLHNGLTISNWSLNGGGQEVVFERLTGKTSQFGSVTISLKNNPAKVKIINIGETGIAGTN